MLALFVALGVVLVTGLAIPAFADKVKSYRSEDRNFYTLGPNQAFKDAVGENPKQFCQSVSDQKCERND